MTGTASRDADKADVVLLCASPGSNSQGTDFTDGPRT